LLTTSPLPSCHRGGLASQLSPTTLCGPCSPSHLQCRIRGHRRPPHRAQISVIFTVRRNHTLRDRLFQMLPGAADETSHVPKTGIDTKWNSTLHMLPMKKALDVTIPGGCDLFRERRAWLKILHRLGERACPGHSHSQERGWFGGGAHTSPPNLPGPMYR